MSDITVSVATSPIQVTVTGSATATIDVSGPGPVSVEVSPGGGLATIDGTTPTTLTGWLRGDGSNVEAHAFISTADGLDNVFLVEQDGPDADHLDSISTNNHYAQFVNDGTGAKQFKFRTEYAGFGMGPCCANIAAGYLDGGSPFVEIGSCNGSSTSDLSILGNRIEVSTPDFRITGQGMRATILGVEYVFSTVGLLLCSAINVAAARTTLGLGKEITFVLDGGDTPLEVNQVFNLTGSPYAGTIRQWRLSSNAADSEITVDIRKNALGPPTDGDSITASATPELAVQQESSSGILTGWTTAIAVDDRLGLKLTAVDGVTTRIVLVLEVAL